MGLCEAADSITLDKLLMGDEVFAITGFISFVIARLLVPLSWWYMEKIYAIVAVLSSVSDHRVRATSPEDDRGPDWSNCDCTSGAYCSDACAELGESEDVLSAVSSRA